MISLPMQEEDEQFPWNESDEPGDREREPIPEEEGPQRIGGDHRGRKRLRLSLATALCLLIGMGYLYQGKNPIYLLIEE